MTRRSPPTTFLLLGLAAVATTTITTTHAFFLAPPPTTTTTTTTTTCPSRRRPTPSTPSTSTSTFTPTSNTPTQLLAVDTDEREEQQERKGIAEDDPLVLRIRADVLAETGVDLDQLLNPGKVVNLEFDLINLRNELEATSEDNARDKIESLILKKETQLATEKRLVMRGWLKNLFLGQSLVAVVLSGFAAYDNVPGVDNLPLPLQAFAFWSFWMFTIPSLRARKPGKVEKKALDLAFLLTPIVSIGLPFLTKDIPTIWWANAVATGASYGYAFGFQKSGSGDDDDEDDADATLPGPLKAAYKALDFGSGRERGVRK